MPTPNQNHSKRRYAAPGGPLSTGDSPLAEPYVSPCNEVANIRGTDLAWSHPTFAALSEARHLQLSLFCGPPILTRNGRMRGIL